MSRSLRFAWTVAQIALGAVRKNPLRSGLTAFGILVGVAAVTIVVALGEGATVAIRGKIDSLGSNALIVRPRETARSGVRDDSSLPPLTEEDARALAREGPRIEHAAPMLLGFSQVAWRGANASARIVGTTLDYFAVRAWDVADGALWSASAETVGDRVCVLGDSVRADLFGSDDPVGRVVRIGRHPFRVVGVLEAKGQNPFGGDQDDVLLMPAVTMRARLTPTRPGQVHAIVLSATSAAAADDAKKEVTAILRQRHRLKEGAENDFRVRSQEEFRKMQDQILGVLNALLLSIAAVSLLVGGIGVMNIMLVSVAERTREIGIRMAIGAREGDILVQFLIEAVALALLGGMAGALLSSFAIGAIGRALDWPMALSPRALGVAVATSSAIGLLFGFLPARRAARMDPIHALRRE